MAMTQKEFDEAYLRSKTKVIDRMLETLKEKGPMTARQLVASLMDIRNPYIIIQSAEIDAALPDCKRALELMAEKGMLRSMTKQELTGEEIYYSR